MATALSAATAVERPLAGVLFDQRGGDSRRRRGVLPGETAVHRSPGGRSPAT